MPSNQIDILLDNALASYAAAKPRWGLKRRVLRNVYGAPPPFAGWIRIAAWAIPATVCAALVFISTRSMVASSLSGSILFQWCEQLQETWFSTALRESTYVWPFVEGTHLLALTLMLGPAMMLDLRLIGVLWTTDPVSKVEARFLPFTLTGFAVMITTGLLLFISEPVYCYKSGYFRIKVVLLLLAGLNALVFHTTIDRKKSEWDTAGTPPWRARWAGILGLIIWTGVVFAGRYTAYNR